jgi:hypothetical protein
MEIAFGLLILAIVVVGLINRGRQKRDWLQEERHEESGAWVDKRPGERGTFGSLDRERENERAAIVRQGRVNELGRLVRDYMIEHYPGFHTRSDDQIKTFTVFARSRSGELISVIGELIEGRLPELPVQTSSGALHTPALKKMAMDFSYANFPALLDMDLEAIKMFDRVCGVFAEQILEGIRLPNAKK